MKQYPLTPDNPAVRVSGQRQSRRKKDIAIELERAGLPPGRILSGPAKRGLWNRTEDLVFPDSLVATRRHGVVWQGDLDLGLDHVKLTRVARRLEENLFVIAGSVSLLGKKAGPSRRLIQEAVWWTRITDFDQDQFLSASKYEIWHPPRRADSQKQLPPARECWASKTLFADEKNNSAQWEREISSAKGSIIKPVLLQRSGTYELVWFPNGRAVLQPDFARIRRQFGEVQFSIHSNRKAIHVRQHGSVVALVWPSPVPNPDTARAARHELALRQLPRNHERLIALIGDYLRPVLSLGGAEELWRAVHRLLNAFAGVHDCSCIWDLQGITEWRKCKAVELNEVTYAFKGTTIPVSSLFQGFEQGQTVAGFLTEHPTVTARQVAVVLDHVVLTLCS